MSYTNEMIETGVITMKLFKKSRISSIALVSVFALWHSPASLAVTYKWTDAEGNVHYTQSPPPDGIEAETIKPPPKVDTEAANKALEKREKALDESRGKRLKQAEKEKQKEQELALKQSNCEQAKARLATYQKPRVNLVDEAGNYTKINEEKRMAELEKSRQLVKEHCD